MKRLNQGSTFLLLVLLLLGLASNGASAATGNSWSMEPANKPFWDQGKYWPTVWTRYFGIVSPLTIASISVPPAPYSSSTDDQPTPTPTPTRNGFSDEPSSSPATMSPCPVPTTAPAPGRKLLRL